MKKYAKALAAIMLMTAAVFTAGCKPEDDPNNGGSNNAEAKAPTVTTTSVTDVTTNSAKSGGVVTDDGGSGVTERGICWSTSHEPTINNDHVSCGSGTGAFVGEMMDLQGNTFYYVRAYATNSVGTSYGAEVSFPTEIPVYTVEVFANPSGYGEVVGGGEFQEGEQCTVTAIAHDGYLFVNWTENGSLISSEESYTFTVTDNRSLIASFDHGFVDLGLPSGTLWATCNVGATTSEGYGDYFAWGETEPKITYNWSTYRYANGTSWNDPQLTKYCSISSYGYNGFTDNLTVLQPSDDAATANWGGGWCMPTADQWRELYQNTTNTWTTQNGVIGRLFTAFNGNSLFLPAAGVRWDDELGYVGTYGYFWSSSLLTDYPGYAWGFNFSSGDCSMYYGYYRGYGQSVRAVRSAPQN